MAKDCLMCTARDRRLEWADSKSWRVLAGQSPRNCLENHTASKLAVSGFSGRPPVLFRPGLHVYAGESPLQLPTNASVPSFARHTLNNAGTRCFIFRCNGHSHFGRLCLTSFPHGPNHSSSQLGTWCLRQNDLVSLDVAARFSRVCPRF